MSRRLSAAERDGAAAGSLSWMPILLRWVVWGWWCLSSQCTRCTLCRLCVIEVNYSRTTRITGRAGHGALETHTHTLSVRACSDSWCVLDKVIGYRFFMFPSDEWCRLSVSWGVVAHTHIHAQHTTKHSRISRTAVRVQIYAEIIASTTSDGHFRAAALCAMFRS